MSHKLLVKDQLGEREVLLIDTVAVGRDPRCDISLADPLLSRRHAEFVALGGGVIVRDLNSRNGILVNGRKLREAVLRPGDVVQISQVAVTFLSSVDAVTMPAPRPVQRDLDYEGAALDPPAATLPGPDDEKTSLLTPGEIEAVAAASAAKSQPPVADGTSGSGAGSTNGTKRPGAWSVQVLADDDRTKLVSTPLPTASGDVAMSEMDARADAAVPGPQGDAVPAPALVVPLTAAAVAPPAPAVVPPAAAVAPSAAAVASTGVRLEPGPGVLPTATIAVRVLALAVVCFTIGVTSTMIRLQPPLTLRWLLVEHVPVAVLLSFVLAVAAGVVVVVALRNATRRGEL